MEDLSSQLGDMADRNDPATGNGHGFRDANAADSAQLALLADAATRRLLSWIWNRSSTAGQSVFEVGRQIIHSDETSTSHHQWWRVLERDGEVAGGLNSYELRPPGPSPNADPVLASVVQPVNELKAVAEGTWYVSVASVFPEFRSQGLGTELLVEANRCAGLGGFDSVTLLVHSFNPGAHRLYRRHGFDEWDRREFVRFDDSDGDGHWILMGRTVA